MNTYPVYEDFFRDVSAKLLLLGRDSGKSNLIFIQEPELANALLVALKNKMSYPCVVVEFPDEDLDAGALDYRTITGAFAVLEPIKTDANGADDIRAGVYERLKPAADQIMARMRNLTRRGELQLDGQMITMEGAVHGNWVGPLFNNMYGWRYSFEWRIPSGICLDLNAWEL
ncbi:hypothetical protein SAMN04487996_10433 [Dyadobacter soli]|uniref:Uncharacterized protein n=1 Tax=Dyadobacter soli TaxID=659014 RepID=A0A1G7B2K8_9BACT|nr:hypothetical protein [Dyadobacter soli]SDE20475.1 hypothetical protein SAMN04487996_10433 [Dyadobacter soli]